MLQVILDRGRVRDGARRGEYTAEFFLDLVTDGEAPERVWRGFSHSAALDAAKEWTNAGATLVDRCGSGNG